MPGIFSQSCDRCDFSCSASERVLYVVCGDGSEAICRHPGEHREAVKATGCEWKQLSREDRFRARRSYLCLDCGEVGFYGRHRGHWEGVAAKIRPVPIADVHRSADLQCFACRQQHLYEIGGQLRPLCPKCQTGRLHSMMLGIS
jgi:hypothetical protein